MPNIVLRQSSSTRLLSREDLTRREATELLAAMLSDDATDAQIAAALVALSAKGETVEELAGMADGLRARAERVNSCHAVFIDTAGTGSSRAKTFNVSTAAAFVIAGAGLAVAKHGNRAASSKSGSADVLTALGVNVSALTKVSENCLNEIGICFMFAPLYHGATARVAGIRRELGVHTTFNLLGPLSNPAGAPRQIIGVWRRELVELLANVLRRLEPSAPGWCTVKTASMRLRCTARLLLLRFGDGAVKTFEIAPQDFGLSESSLEHVRGGAPQANAAIIREVLANKRRDEARALIVANAAGALLVGGMAKSSGKPRDWPMRASTAAQRK